MTKQGSWIEHSVPSHIAGRRLTDREKQVAEGLRDGFTARNIADSLGIHPKSVHTLIARLKDFYGADDRETLLNEIRTQGI